MLFQSIEFILFLSIVFVSYWLVFKQIKTRNAFLLLANYVFYGWWDWRFLILIAAMSGIGYSSGIFIEKNDKNQNRRKVICTITIVIELLILCVFKYLNFFAESFTKLLALIGLNSDFATLKIILPVGISFYTFQLIGYTIDVYKKAAKPTHDFVAFFAFISYFPQLIAGPIERSTTLLPQFLKERKFDCNKAIDGCRQILWGLFKKIVVADNCAIYVNDVFANYQNETGSTLFCAAVLFSMQIYADFSGYSDIAIGCAKLFNIDLSRNFKFPYFSKNIIDFWRRWNITLMSWFRDYVYFPLGGSRVSKAKHIRNIFIVFLLSGLWHGANWTFVVWGAYNAILYLLCISIFEKGRINEFSEKNTITKALLIIINFIFVVFGWIIFRSESLTDTIGFLDGIFNYSIFTRPKKMISMDHIYVSLQYYIPLIIMLLFEFFNRNKEHGLSLDIKSHFLKFIIYLLILFVILMFHYRPTPFVYFQF